MKRNRFRLLLSAVLMMCCMSAWAGGDWTIIEQPTCSTYGTMQNPANKSELRLVPKLAHHFGDDGKCTVCGQPAPTKYNGTPATSLVTITESNYAKYGLTEMNKGCVMGWTVITTAEEFMKYLNDGSSNNYIQFNAFLAENIILDITVSLPSNISLYTKCLFDGTGHTISDMYRSGDDYVGLYEDNIGTIRNLGLISPKIEVNGVYGGCICGNNTGTIENCFVIDGNIIGENSDLYGIACQGSEGQIINCYAISNYGNVGRSNIGTITNSHGATTGSIPDDFYANTLSELNKSKVNGMTWYIDAQHSSIPYPVMMPPIWYYPSSVTCEESGLKAHWYCAGCGKYFFGANHTQETTLEALYLPALGHNLSIINDKAHCDRCNQDFSNFVSIDNNTPILLTKYNDEYFLKADFVLDGGVNYLAPVDFIVNGTFTYHRNVSGVKAGAWQCWYEPFELELTEYVLENMDVAEVAGVLIDNEGNTVVAFRKIDSGWMKANTPYVFRPKDAILTTESMELKTTSPELRKSEETTFYNMSTYDKFTFGGNYTARHNDSWYTLNTSGQFQRMKEGVNLKGQRFWMTVEARKGIPYEYGGIAGVKESIDFTVLGDDEPTGIQEASPKSSPEGKDLIYNLQRQKVTSIQSGQVYIMNGKKFFAK